MGRSSGKSFVLGLTLVLLVAVVGGAKATTVCNIPTDKLALCLPAITGKLELEYEGELVGGASIARELIRRAADATLKARAGTPNLDQVIIWFDEGGALQVDDEQPSALVAQAFSAVPGLLDTVHRTGLATPDDPGATAAACELVLEALVARRKISRSDRGQYGRAVSEKRRRPGEDLFS